MLRWIDSQTNFVMVNTGRAAADVVANFANHRVLLPAAYARLENYIRVSLGMPAQMQEFWRVWDLMPGGHHHE
jgi:histidinol-phosphate/aromatic aminotransferase/cobyric acid decarboxylase-like protein